MVCHHANIGEIALFVDCFLQHLIQFVHGNQAAVQSDPRPLEIDLHRSIEKELK